jgi:hypothetical protein
MFLENNDHVKVEVQRRCLSDESRVLGSDGH